MLRYRSNFYTIDLPEFLADLTKELTPQAEALAVIAEDLSTYLGPANPDAVAAFPDYTFPQVIATSKNPMLIASLDSQVIAAQTSLPLAQLLEMQTSYVNDFNKLLSPVSANPGAPPIWPIDQKSADALFKLFQNPPATFGPSSSVNQFLEGFGGLKTKYAARASMVRTSLDKLMSSSPNETTSAAASIIKLNLSTNSMAMQKMTLSLRDSHLNGNTFTSLLNGKLVGGFSL